MYLLIISSSYINLDTFNSSLYLMPSEIANVPLVEATPMVTLKSTHSTTYHLYSTLVLFPQSMILAHELEKIVTAHKFERIYRIYQSTAPSWLFNYKHWPTPIDDVKPISICPQRASGILLQTTKNHQPLPTPAAPPPTSAISTPSSHRTPTNQPTPQKTKRHPSQQQKDISACEGRLLQTPGIEPGTVCAANRAHVATNC